MSPASGRRRNIDSCRRIDVATSSSVCPESTYLGRVRRMTKPIPYRKLLSSVRVGERSSAGRASVCGTEGRGFKSRRSPQNFTSCTSLNRRVLGPSFRIGNNWETSRQSTPVHAARLEKNETPAALRLTDLRGQRCTKGVREPAVLLREYRLHS